MFVHNFVYGWLSVGFLLDVNVDSWVLNDEWHLLGDSVLFDIIDSEISDIGDFVWNLDLGGVVLPKFNNVWLINGDCEESLVPFGLFELMFNSVWLLLVLSHCNLLRGDVWHLLDDGVVNSLGDFIGYLEFFLIRDLVIDGVWNLLGGHKWYLVLDSVWHFSAGGVGDLEFDLIWNLSFNSVWDLSFNFIWLKSLNFVLFGDIGGDSNLVWD